VCMTWHCNQHFSIFRIHSRFTSGLANTTHCFTYGKTKGGVRGGGARERHMLERANNTGRFDKIKAKNTKVDLAVIFNPPGIFDWSRVKHDHHRRASTQSAISCVFCILRRWPRFTQGRQRFHRHELCPPEPDCMENQLKYNSMTEIASMGGQIAVFAAVFASRLAS